MPQIRVNAILQVHKRRLKALEVEPYSIEEAERAAGHGSYVAPKKRKMETQPSKEEVAKGKKVKIELKEEKMTEWMIFALNQPMVCDVFRSPENILLSKSEDFSF